MPAFDPHVEAAPNAAGALQSIEHDMVGLVRQAGIGMQEEQNVASRARCMVASRLPPSTTITSTPSERKSARPSSIAAMCSPSSRTGTIMESFDIASPTMGGLVDRVGDGTPFSIRRA
jgi:hypothetical protein